MSKQYKKRRRFTIADLLDESSKLYENKKSFVKREIDSEAKECIETVVDSINTKDDIKADTAIRTLSTLKSLYLIDFEVDEDIKGHIRVKKWFKIK